MCTLIILNAFQSKPNIPLLDDLADLFERRRGRFALTSVNTKPTFVVFILGLPRPCRQIERRCSCSLAPSQGMLRCITFHDDSMQLRIPSPAGTTIVVPPRNFGGRNSNDEAPAAPVLLRGSRMLPPNLGKPGAPVAFHPWRVCRDPLLNRIFVTDLLSRRTLGNGY